MNIAWIRTWQNPSLSIVLRRRDTKESVYDKMLPVDDNAHFRVDRTSHYLKGG